MSESAEVRDVAAIEPPAGESDGVAAPVRGRRRLVSILLWVLAGALALSTFLYQDKTGPTYPIEREIETAKGTVSTVFLRSENLGTPLKIMLEEPVPEGVTAYVRYRRYRSNDEWSQVAMQEGDFEFSRRGSVTKVKGYGVELPSLDKRAGKYEYFVMMDDGGAEPWSVTGDKPIYARYKGAVPMPVLLVHILAIFVSMTIALRTVMEALRRDGRYKKLIWASLISLLFGAFVMGPVVQWYAFRVWWSGIPFGWDWTDNKVLLELAAWVVALLMNRGDRRNPASVLAAGFVTLLVYFIPHSIFGSEYDYTKGAGRGTTG